MCREFSWAEPNWEAAGNSEKERKRSDGMSFGQPFPFLSVFFLSQIFITLSSGKTSLPSSWPVCTFRTDFGLNGLPGALCDCRSYVT